jgi:hypothetical protein
MNQACPTLLPLARNLRHIFRIDRLSRHIALTQADTATFLQINGRDD